MKYLCIILIKCSQLLHGSLASLPPVFGSYWGTPILQTLSLPTPGKNPAGADAPCITFCRGGGQKLDRKREDNCTSFWLRRSTNYQPSLIFHSLTGGSNIFKFGLSKGVVSHQRNKSKLWIPCWKCKCLAYHFYRAAWNADAVLRWEFRPSVRLSVCLSVRPSDAWIVTKRQKDMFRFLYDTKDNLS